MRVFDFNVHLPFVDHEDVNVVVSNDLSLTNEGLIKGFSKNKRRFENAEGANFLLFNVDLFSESIESFREVVSNNMSYFSLTALMDFRRTDLDQYLKRAKVNGVRAVMVNSYLQRICDSDFAKVYEMCRIAESNDMIICIDGSYGTTKMYEYDNLKLAGYIADRISTVPIVIIHSGGYRVVEAMLLALDKANIWLDTSFSLAYYLGSSIEKDFAFVYKRLNCERVVYGSDVPYLNSDRALEIHLEFFKKYRFTDLEAEKILFKNASELIGFNP